MYVEITDVYPSQNKIGIKFHEKAFKNKLYAVDAHILFPLIVHDIQNGKKITAGVSRLLKIVKKPSWEKLDFTSALVKLFYKKLLVEYKRPINLQDIDQLRKKISSYSHSDCDLTLFLLRIYRLDFNTLTDELHVRVNLPDLNDETYEIPANLLCEFLKGMKLPFRPEGIPNIVREAATSKKIQNHFFLEHGNETYKFVLEALRYILLHPRISRRILSAKREKLGSIVASLTNVHSCERMADLAYFIYKLGQLNIYFEDFKEEGLVAQASDKMNTIHHFAAFTHETRRVFKNCEDLRKEFSTYRETLVHPLDTIRSQLSSIKTACKVVDKPETSWETLLRKPAFTGKIFSSIDPKWKGTIPTAYMHLYTRFYDVNYQDSTTFFQNVAKGYASGGFDNRRIKEMFFPDPSTRLTEIGKSL